jgi:serine phosphatase RsbU (regulator of sigma subunit)/anti-sigma regulatory factor (Ser/Thr protein kinase)
VIGSVWVGLPLRSIGDRLRASRGQQALLLALLTLLGACLAFLTMSRLLRPMGTLRAGIERIGRGDLDTPIRMRGRTELALLGDAVDEMAAALKSAQAEMLERERLAREVELAREIQRSLLPSQVVVAGDFDIRGDQRAAAEVGGDYWDVLPLPDGKVGIAIADVAGKGLAGCLVMSMLSALLRALRESYVSPAAMLAALDAQLSQSLRPGVFVTMCYGVLDPSTGRLTYASAGHNPLLVWRRRTGAVETRASQGIPIGAVRGGAIRATLRDETLQLEPGDVCVQYTDGYTEAFRGGSGEQFGADRLARAVGDHASGGGAAVLDGLARAVRGWSGDGALDDDETLVVLTFESRAAAPSRAHVESDDEARLRGALDLLARAERHGGGLALEARLDRLPALDGWVRGRPGLASLAAGPLELIVTALYEVCSNIVEHGCGEDGRAGLEVFWLPDAGRFVIRDQGRPFRPGERLPTDFNDPAVRSRGRGLGLEIIHRAASEISYHPATPRGNITVLAIGPGEPKSTREGNAP